MNRRTFNKKLLLAGACIASTKVVSAFSMKGLLPTLNGLETPPLTIGQLITASFPTVRGEMLNGSTWISPTLQKAERDGRLKIWPLNHTVQDEQLGLVYEVYQIYVPLCWTKIDETHNSTEAQKIAFVSLLLENALENHDNILIEQLGSRSGIALKRYRYRLTEVYENPRAPTYHCVLYTAIAFIPPSLSLPYSS